MGKYFVERILESFESAYGFRFVALRYFNREPPSAAARTTTRRPRMTAIARSVTALNRLLFALAKWLVYAIVLLMLWEVLSRYLLAAPTSWAPARL